MELQIVHFLNHLGQGTFLDFLTIIISSSYFLIFLWSLLVILVLIFDKENGKQIALATVLVVIIYFVINDLILKQTLASIFFRERPFIAYSDIVPFGQPFSDSSFPSGHMAATAALATVFVYYYRRAWPFALVFVLFMAFARIHNGMHYPSDILAGAVLGVGYGLLALWLVGRIKSRSKA